LGRKLAKAAEQLKTTKKNVLDIALDLGFEYPEVMSRAFRKQFGVSPAGFRSGKTSVAGIPKACIVERDIANYRGSLALKGASVLLGPLPLMGVRFTADTHAEDFKEQLTNQSHRFFSGTASQYLPSAYKAYTVAACSGNDDGLYTVFCALDAASGIQGQDITEWVIPGGWYASFAYQGDMFDIREVFIDDLYKWIMVKEAELNPNGVGMLTIYPINYPQNNTVQILIPITKPV
jgi:AraC family transcriptional regulator